MDVERKPRVFCFETALQLPYVTVLQNVTVLGACPILVAMAEQTDGEPFALSRFHGGRVSHRQAHIAYRWLTWGIMSQPAETACTLSLKKLRHSPKASGLCNGGSRRGAQNASTTPAAVA